MSTVVVFSPCCERKDDTVPIQQGARVVIPGDYLGDIVLLQTLMDTRSYVLSKPEARRGHRDTYAFDLYVRTGKAYRDLLNHYQQLKARLLGRDDIQWFFLSGGYGVIHALEAACCYDASFARFPGVLYTGDIWRQRGKLTQICDAIVQRAEPSRVYVFGSQAYTDFVKRVDFWMNRNRHNIRIKIFESKGNAGTAWLSPRLADLARAIIGNSLDRYDIQYSDEFVHQ